MKNRFLMRLDDASEKMDVGLWTRMESLLDKYDIRPLVGVIPHCEDPMMDKYPEDASFWEKVASWQNKGWIIALHGYNHVCNTKDGGINPVNKRSEFAGNPYDVQLEKIKKGLAIFRTHGIEPRVFFAPSHTFDITTLEVLKEVSTIRIISDTWAWDSYEKNGFTFVPQQSGQVRNVPFSLSTFCYHPNTMKEQAFNKLENFLSRYHDKFCQFPIIETTRHISMIDKVLQWAYFKTR